MGGKNMNEFIMTLDEGTTSARAIVVDHEGNVISSAQKEFTQYYPEVGWLEQDPIEIWTTTMEVIGKCMTDGNLQPEQIKAIGITNQRETVVVWNKNTGVPVYRDIVWGDRRTAGYCDALIDAGKNDLIRNKTGLIINSEFSAPKINWILNNVEGARAAAEAGDLIFGNIDTWILWNLTGAHMTDVGNASRTLLFNVHTMDWDDELLELFDIPKSMCPQAKDSCGHFANTKVENLFHGLSIPVTGILGDQMASAFGQALFRKGDAKITWGTAAVYMRAVGSEPILSNNGLVTTLGWRIKDDVQFFLEGTVWNGASQIQWLRDEMDMLDESKDSEYFAKKSTIPLGTVYMVPSFSGLGAPYWDDYARGTIFGMSRGTNKNDIIRATLDSITYQTKDQIVASDNDLGEKLDYLRVDGGAAPNNLVCQFCADICGMNVERPVNVETTAIGAAYIAGLAIGYWNDYDDIIRNKKVDHIFHPKMDPAQSAKLYKGWQNCVNAIMTWSKGDREI